MHRSQVPRNPLHSLDDIIIMFAYCIPVKSENKTESEQEWDESHAHMFKAAKLSLIFIAIHENEDNFLL